jgi:hypothetical protein
MELGFSADPSSGHSAAPASCPSTPTTYRNNHAIIIIIITSAFKSTVVIN